ncbi:UDP-N-acetylmuramoyl-tripeptide--D-alanyl-D-alanine ligase [Marinobacterium rhizophilum]|uniref:UDP-N-acetylmuramoyl-tripeptide--D-alanyl-D-alanine ligase n=1 Tax=Marinobacterium rhizophilum TaxID=420402 RepID=A0ABY5HNU9_9GAMM|nr:UDP-N-acetylmuramoyl-tripeptide--D-alanyl-D-alanine ligase [Marinobacterium rhizophilum]UTW14100.1 UDP-N-acetylmuramoyl-tripeptide--D-alanyl-D-alanine ligase [Marinobacterium rhizophilum]
MIGTFSLGELVQVLDARLEGADGTGVRVGRVSTDTRRIQPGDLFVALRGENFDAHDFVDQARSQGAIAAVVERLLPLDLPQLVVADSRLALGAIAQYNRTFFAGSLIAVTGSSGKTTVKEMLATILSGAGQTLATRGNLNNDIGVPLTLFELEQQHRYAVIEMGASGPGEIDYVCRLARPDVAVLNNAFGAHLEGFGSLEGVVRAKGEIFNGLNAGGTAIVNADDPHAHIWLRQLEERRVLSFGIERSDVDVTAQGLFLQPSGCHGFDLVLGGQSAAVQLKVLGRHNVANALAAAAAAFAAGLEPSLIVRGLERFEAVAGRMKPRSGVAGCQVIDDSYNANPASVKAAIDVLASLPGKRALVLGDMAELGADAAQQHADIGVYAAAAGLDHFYATGPLCRHAIAAYSAEAGLDGRDFDSRAELTGALITLAHAQLTLLIKGSRSAAMDQVVSGLTQGESH